MLLKQRIEALSAHRTLGPAVSRDELLGPLALLPGRWSNLPELPGRGWNMIALPFAASGGSLNYRLLLNQYDETLDFSLVDKGIPNRGIDASHSPAVNTDQTLVALDYQQAIAQIAAEDSPVSGLAGGPGAPIHHEPGLWINLLNHFDEGLDIARLASVPHGDSVLAMGRSSVIAGAPVIPDINGLPIGVDQALSNPYLAPYRHFHAHPFRGIFDPTVPNALLRAANVGMNILRTTVLEVDSTLATGGIVNIPFVVRQANAASMRSTFWIQEIRGDDGEEILRLQYSQVVFLDFFPTRDGSPGMIRWPHISINTLQKLP